MTKKRNIRCLSGAIMDQKEGISLIVEVIEIGPIKMTTREVGGLTCKHPGFKLSY